MPAIETLQRFQLAVLWLVTGSDQYDEPIFGVPTVVNVRWIWKKGKITDKQGNTTTLDAQVVINGTIPLRSVMWLASVPGSPNPTDPIAAYAALERAGTPERELCRVETSTYTSDIKNRNLNSQLGLKRYKDAVMPIPLLAPVLSGNRQLSPDATNLTGGTRLNPNAPMNLVGGTG